MSDPSDMPDNTLSLLGTLSTALKDAKPPYCSGILNVNEKNHVLFYGNAQGEARRIDLSKVDELELQKLSETCAPATFGRNEEDVLDLSYRKARKLDEEYFATKLDLSSSGLEDIIRYGLLEGVKASKGFSAELYKLNVYDKGSFFKAHKDTPRGKNMFGSLVVLFPTAHEGGAFTLRHGGKEWVLDFGRELAENKSVPSGRAPIMYAAFFSDVEHEVAPVTSGYRVTLTYNLYFNTTSQADMSRANEASKLTVPANAVAFKNALSSLLDDSSFMPEGGSIGFGLFHQYPIVESTVDTNDLVNYLKGRDAMVMQICKEMSLEAGIWLLYDEDWEDMRVISQQPIEPSCTLEDESFTHFAIEQYDALVVKPYSENNSEPEPESSDEPTNRTIYVAWVKNQTDLNTISTSYTTYGNEPSHACQYADACLIVDIGPPGYR